MKNVKHSAQVSQFLNCSVTVREARTKPRDEGRERHKASRRRNRDWRERWTGTGASAVRDTRQAQDWERKPRKRRTNQPNSNSSTALANSLFSRAPFLPFLPIHCCKMSAQCHREAPFKLRGIQSALVALPQWGLSLLTFWRRFPCTVDTRLLESIVHCNLLITRRHGQVVASLKLLVESDRYYDE